jgi:hypothetical protein
MLLGFHPVSSKKPLVFAGHEEPYVELIKELTPPSDAITSDTDVSVLFRVEGFWDVRSEFEGAEI